MTKAALHIPGDRETKASFYGTMYRVPCSCRWVGCWWKSATEAELSYARHEAGITVTFTEAR